MGADESGLLPVEDAEFAAPAAVEPAVTPIDQKLARLGELTSIVTLISPLPAFISCHKTTFEKNEMLAKLSFNFLLAMLVTNAVWLAYSLKVYNLDLIIINFLGTIIASCFVSVYLYVKLKIARL